MSSGLIRRYANRVIAQCSFSERALESLSAILDTVSGSFLELLYDVSREAQLEEDEMVYRTAAIVFEHAAVHLCDDLSDRECTVLEKPYRDGPVCTLLLQNLFQFSLQKTSVRKSTIICILDLLNKTADGQCRELAVKRWDYNRVIEFAEVLNGFQLKAYLLLLCDSTELFKMAEEWGPTLGTILHLAVDISQNDKRLRTLSDMEKHQLLKYLEKFIKTFDNNTPGSFLRPLEFIEMQMADLQKSLHT